MHIIKKIALLFITSAVVNTSSVLIDTTTKDIYTTHGRTEIVADNSIILIGAASSVTFGFKGTDCSLKLTAKENKFVQHNYAVIEVNGQYYSREKIQPTGTEIFIKVTKGNHIVNVYNATEAKVGYIVFNSAAGELYKVKGKPKKKIEFIGDSITCGMGNDIKQTPCGTAEWYDQHNAYYSYAPLTARALGADYVLSSVSGIGMYRNWNDEHQNEAIMPDVYENLYLDKNTQKPYDFNFKPAVTCIALGTNDLSTGDGKKPRLPFNEDKYVENYITFIQTVYKHSPNTQIVLLNSPMIKGERDIVFSRCLKRIVETVNAQKGHKPVTLFNFSNVTPHGCGNHPEIEEDKLMASQLAPYLKTLLN